MPFTATLDADVLYQVRVRVLLLEAARYGLYRPTWSDKILAEVRKALTSSGKLTPEQIDRAVTRLRDVDEDALVTGYEALVQVMECHPDDRHVLAVAVHSGAEVIVTWNATHFPPKACEPYGIQIQSPDEFLSNLWDQKPNTMLEVLTTVTSYYGANSVTSFLKNLHRLPQLTTMVLESPQYLALEPEEPNEN